jgi:hypothetical protein
VTPAISIAPEVMQVRPILKERAVVIPAHWTKEYGISSAGGYWTKVVFSANCAA